MQPAKTENDDIQSEQTRQQRRLWPREAMHMRSNAHALSHYMRSNVHALSHHMRSNVHALSHYCFVDRTVCTVVVIHHARRSAAQLCLYSSPDSAEMKIISARTT